MKNLIKVALLAVILGISICEISESTVNEHLNCSNLSIPDSGFPPPPWSV